MEFADADGLEAVTIRRLAQDLGVTPMALYWHFADKDALLLAIAERLWDEAAAELGDVSDVQSGQAGWAQLDEIVGAAVTVLRARPGCATLARKDRSTTSTTAAWRSPAAPEATATPGAR